MRRITLIYAYYENPGMLMKQIQEWMQYEPAVLEEMSFIVVDDASPRNPAEQVLAVRPHGLDIRLYRVGVNVPWGQDGARNIAMKECTTEWALMTDMDHMLTRLGSQRLVDFVRHRATRGRYYMPARVQTSGAHYHPHPNSFVFNRADFWKMGGYDEDFVGFYGSDGNFRKCAKGSGLLETPVNDFSLVLHGSNDVADANTRDFTRKEGTLWAATIPHLNVKRMGPAYRAVNPLRLPYNQVI
jgi:hypothetical protein